MGHNITALRYYSACWEPCCECVAICTFVYLNSLNRVTLLSHIFKYASANNAHMCMFMYEHEYVCLQMAIQMYACMHLRIYEICIYICIHIHEMCAGIQVINFARQFTWTAVSDRRRRLIQNKKANKYK